MNEELKQAFNKVRELKLRYAREKEHFPLDKHFRLDVARWDKLASYGRKHKIFNFSKIVRDVLDKGFEALGL